MNPCTQYKSLWSEWQAGEVSAAEKQLLWQHAQNCALCNDYNRQMQALLRALNTLPAPGSISDDLVDRLITNAHTNQTQPQSNNTVRNWSIAAALTIAVFGAVLLSRINYNPISRSVPATAANIMLQLNNSQNVHLVFDSDATIEQVEYTIELPSGVEITGYPDVQILQWEGQLEAGSNSLSLPLIGRKAGINDTLKARIRYQGTQRELHIRLSTPDRQSSPEKDNLQTEKTIKPTRGRLTAQQMIRRDNGVTTS